MREAARPWSWGSTGRRARARRWSTRCAPRPGGAPACTWSRSTSHPSGGWGRPPARPPPAAPGSRPPGAPPPSRAEIETQLLAAVREMITDVAYELGGEHLRRPEVDVVALPGQA